MIQPLWSRFLVRPFVAPVVLVMLPVASVACSNILDIGGDDHAPASAPKGTNGTDAKASTTSSALATYCDARVKFTASCTQLDDCETQMSSNCTGTFEVYSDAYLTSLTKCGFPANCPVPPASRISDDAIDNCVSDEQDKTPPTEAMQNLADDLCAVCPNLHADSGGACQDKFWFHGHRLPDGSVQVSGSGTSFDRYTDDWVTKVRAACVPKAPTSNVSCWSDFYHCTDQLVSSVQPSSVANACAVGNAAPAP